MSWEQHSYQENSRVIIQLKNGEILTVENKYELDKFTHPSDAVLHRSILKLEVGSVYEVGFGFGRHLVTLNNLGHETGGCELFNVNFGFGTKHFGLGKQENSLGIDTGSFVELGVKEGLSELVLCDGPLSVIGNPEHVLKEMLKVSSKYVLVVDHNLDTVIFEHLNFKSVGEGLYLFNKEENDNVKERESAGNRLRRISRTISDKSVGKKGSDSDKSPSQELRPDRPSDSGHSV